MPADPELEFDEDEPPRDLTTVAGYLAALGMALVAGAAPPTPPPELLASLGPSGRAEFDRKVANYYKAAGQRAPSSGEGPPAKFPPIKGYEIIRDLGEGGQGVVYLARQPHLFDRRFAIKVLKPPSGVQADSWTGHVAVEVEALCRLNLPGVVRIVDHGATGDGRPYLAMDYVAGTSLFRRIRAVDLRETRPQPVRAAARLTEQLAEIVAECHARGIFHRDLKPGNILLPGPEALDTEAVLADLSEAETPVITDFGMAKVFLQPQAAPVSQVAHRIGTSPYMAPEQWDANRFGRVGPGTDVWGLGVVLYELLIGRRPFVGDEEAIRMQVCDGDPAWPRRRRVAIPPDLEAIALKALQRSPAARYPDAAALAADLHSFLGGEPVGARRPSVARRLGVWHRRNRRLVRLGGAAVATIFVLAAISVGLLGVLRGQLMTARARAASDHEARVASARGLAQRDDWAGALDAYRAAIADDRDDARGLRIERLDGYLAVNDLAPMRREIADLSASAGAGGPEARLALANGMLLLCDRATRPAGLAAVRAALDARDATVPLADADRSYAESLLETTPRAILARLREAVARDPFHNPARSGLVVALLADGRLAEARDEASRLKAAAPRSTLPDFVLILVDLCEGDRAAADRQIDDLAGRLGPSRAGDIASLRGFVGHAGNLIDALSRSDPNMPDLLNKGRILLEATALNAQQRQGLPFDLPVPTLGALGEAVEALATASGVGASPARFDLESRPVLSVGSLFQLVQRLIAIIDNNETIQDEAGFRRLEVAQRSSDDALFSALMAMNRIATAFAAHQRGDYAGFSRLIEETQRWCERGANGPTLLPRSPLRYKCLVLEAIAQLVAMKFRKDVGPDLPTRLRDNLHRLVAEGRAHPQHRRQALPMVIQIITTPLTDAELGDWGIKPGDDRTPYRERCRWLGRYARDLLDDWQADDPTSGAVVAGFAALEKWPEPNP